MSPVPDDLCFSIKMSRERRRSERTTVFDSGGVDNSNGLFQLSIMVEIVQRLG